jgi:hypothetical protein
MLSKLPLTKTENIVVQNLESELLIYNLITNKVFCLNETSAVVYQACDGKTAFEDFKSKSHLTDETIFLALDLLKKENLLDENFVSPLQGMNRRKVVKIIGKTSLIAIPIISSLMAPTSGMAASTCGGASPAGTILGCTQLESQCLAMFQMCASCSTTATITIGPGACDAANPFLCTCS